MGEGAIFPPLPQKCQFCFTQEIKDNYFKLCPKSVSNYQNQLVEAEKLFKKVTYLPDSTVFPCNEMPVRGEFWQPSTHVCQAVRQKRKLLLSGNKRK